MPTATTKSIYWSGALAGLPFIVIVVPFALLFGVAATEAGLPLDQVMAFSFLVIAGASQFTALQFMQENAPVFVILASALAVNLRMAMYSAALVPHLGATALWIRGLLSYFMIDQSYTLAYARYEQEPDMPLAQKVAYFFGVMTPIIPLWYVFTWVGAVVGAQIPDRYGLDFAMPIAFLAMVGPALRTPAHVAAALTSTLLALCLTWVPLNLGLLIAAGIAMAVGAEVERRTT